MSDYEDPHALPLTISDDGTMPAVSMSDDRTIIKVELVEFGLTVYRHDPLDGSAPCLIIDIDNDGDDPQPLKIYRNDWLVHDELAKAKEAPQ